VNVNDVNMECSWPAGGHPDVRKHWHCPKSRVKSS